MASLDSGTLSRKVSNYERLFLQPVKTAALHGKAIYVRPEFHQRIQRIVRLLDNDKISMYSYLDRVLEHHFASFDGMLARFEEFARRMDALCHAHRIGEPDPWLDNQQVCLLLNISKRTLQTLRGNGSLSYTQINHKIYYRAEDVRSFLAVLEAWRKHEQKRRNGV